MEIIKPCPHEADEGIIASRVNGIGKAHKEGVIQNEILNLRLNEEMKLPLDDYQLEGVSKGCLLTSGDAASGEGVAEVESSYDEELLQSI